MLECVGGLDVKMEEKLKMLMELKDTTRLSYDNATNGIGKIASALLTVFKVKENDIVAVGTSPNSSLDHSLNFTHQNNTQIGVHENVQLVLIVLGIVKLDARFYRLILSIPRLEFDLFSTKPNQRTYSHHSNHSSSKFIQTSTVYVL